MTDFVTTANGDRVAFDRAGSGPGLVFVAGAGPFRAIDPVTTATAEAVTGATTIVHDRLGRGESTVDGVIGLDRELAAIATLIEEAGGSAVLCGHSSGCSIALAAAAAGLPVTGLVLWEAPFTEGPEVTREWIAEFERLLDGGDLVGALAEYMRDMPAEWRDEATSDPVAVAQVVSFRADGESLVWVESAPYAELFAGIRIPVLCVYGEDTFPGMPEVAAAIAAAIPGGESREVPGAYHTWEAEPMARVLSDFVAAAASAKR